MKKQIRRRMLALTEGNPLRLCVAVPSLEMISASRNEGLCAGCFGPETHSIFDTDPPGRCRYLPSQAFLEGNFAPY